MLNKSINQLLQLCKSDKPIGRSIHWCNLDLSYITSIYHSIRSVSQWVSEAVSESVSESVSEWVSQLVSQPVSQLVSQSFSQLVSQSVSQSITPPWLLLQIFQKKNLTISNATDYMTHTTWPSQTWRRLTAELTTAVCHQTVQSRSTRIGVRSLSSLSKVSQTVFFSSS